MTKLVHFLIIITLVGTAGCGFALRGIENQPNNKNLAIHHTPIKITGVAQHQALDKMLTSHLKRLGFVVDNTLNKNNIEITSIDFKSYQLVGVLTEIRMTLTANVRYHLPNGQTHQTPILVERSYQYNQNEVAASDREAAQVRGWLYESLATRISEQYSTLNQNNR